MSDLFEQGYNLFKRDGELMLAEVWRLAGKMIESMDDQREFVAGYMAGRQRRDAYLKEQRDAIEGRDSPESGNDPDPIRASDGC